MTTIFVHFFQKKIMEVFLVKAINTSQQIVCEGRMFPTEADARKKVDEILKRQIDTTKATITKLRTNEDPILVAEVYGDHITFQSCQK
jgi:hypothetical protein